MKSNPLVEDNFYQSDLASTITVPNTTYTPCTIRRTYVYVLQLAITYDAEANCMPTMVIKLLIEIVVPSCIDEVEWYNHKLGHWRWILNLMFSRPIIMHHAKSFALSYHRWTSKEQIYNSWLFSLLKKMHNQVFEVRIWKSTQGLCPHNHNKARPFLLLPEEHQDHSHRIAQRVGDPPALDNIEIGYHT